MHDHVPFINCDSEPRIMEIVKGMIEKEEVPEYKCFTEEPQKKKDRRKKKWEREQKEAEAISSMLYVLIYYYFFRENQLF